MKLYHGTKKEYLPSILKDGLKRKMNGGDSVYIYTCKTPEEARKWGEIVFEIETNNKDILRNFYGENPIWQILIKNNVEPKSIKLL